MNDPGSPKLTKDQLLEQIVDDFTREVRAGKKPDIQVFKEKFPKVANEIDDLLSSVALIEELKQQKDSKPSSRQANLEEITRLEKLGDYRILRELGRGGMGIVLEAVHESLGRRVALKVLPGRSFEDEKAVMRFHREAQAAAALHHTNIVPVFGVGQDEGFNYYVMEFIEGYGLNEVLRVLKSGTNTEAAETSGNGPSKIEPTMLEVSTKQRTTSINLGEQQKAESGFELAPKPFRVIPPSRLPDEKTRFKWTANLGVQIADALDYAHEQETLHRDLKPANFVLDQFDKVWLTDFGLAKNMSNNSMTLTGEILGTPQYMAPESFEGKYDERSETYCLGLTLYELATLKPAFEDGSTAELIRAIMSTTPTEPKKVNRAIPSDLNTIIQKAISREPERRYQTAGELREDLRSFMADRPIQARKAGSFEQAWRWSRRNPMLATLSLVSLFLLAATATTATVGYWIAHSKTKQLAIENEKLESQKKETVDALADASISQMLMQLEQERAEYNFLVSKKLVDKLSKRILGKGSGGSLLLTANGLPLLADIDSEITNADTELLLQLANFYKAVANDDSASVEYQTESMRALRRVGNAYHMSGDFRHAVLNYDLAIREFKVLLANEPDSVELGLELSQTRCQLGTAFRQIAAYRSQVVDDTKAALMYFRYSLDEFKRARDGLIDHEKASLPEIQFELAKVHNMLAGVWPTADQREKSPDWPKAGDVVQFRLSEVNAAIDILDTLTENYPDDLSYQTLRMKTYRNRAQFKLESDDQTGQEDLQLVFDEYERIPKLVTSENGELQFIKALALQTNFDVPTEERIKRLNDSIEISDRLLRLYRERVEYQYIDLKGRIELAKAYAADDNEDMATKNLDAAIKSLVRFRQGGALGSRRSTLRKEYSDILRTANKLGGTSLRQEIVDQIREESERQRDRRAGPRKRR